MFDWFAWLETEIAALWAHVRYHKAAGTTPSGSVVAPVPAPAPQPVAPPAVTAAPAPAAPVPSTDTPPVFTTEPSAPAPADDPYPVDGVASFADANRLIRIKALDELRLTEPRVPHGFRVEDMAENPAKFGLDAEGGKEVQADCNKAMMLGQEACGGNPNAPWRQSEAFTSGGPGGTMINGAQIPDALTFNGSNVINGVTVYAGVKLSDIPSLIEKWKANGLLPIIDHQAGVVAH